MLKELTPEQYNKLSIVHREIFLNNGGVISAGTAEKVIDSPVSVEPQNKPIEPECVHSPKKEDSGLSSAQSAQFNEQTSEPEYVLPDPKVFGFADPVELLFFLDEDISSGRVKLHGWQVQFMLDFANGIHNKPCENDPFQAIVRACNGSGKDKYCIAPCAVWLCMCTTVYASAIVTSSSGVQLDNQTCAYIEQLCRLANEKIHKNVWKINYRYYECLETRSPIMCFATDEPGKAEGYHPLKHGSAMGLFESEAKTVPDEIYIAQNKCTGYTHRAIVSTPGLPLGHFYDLDSTAIDRRQITGQYTKSAIDYVKYHITAFDCDHISRNYIEQMKRDLPGGESGSAYRSQVLAEFGTTSEEVVIPYSHLWSLHKACERNEVKWNREDFNTGGLDLSRGGDELVLSVRNGNKLLCQVPFNFDNTEDSVEYLIELFHTWKLNRPDALVFVDCGGLGAPIYDRLKGLGWHNLRYVVNQGSPADKRRFKNKGAEMWWNLGTLIERKEIIKTPEMRLDKQLVSRHYKKQQDSKHQLESKKEAKSKGRPSPDRADSMVLCFSNYRPSAFEEPKEEKMPMGKLKEYKPIGDLTLRGMVKQKPANAGLPTTRITQNEFDELQAEFNMNRARRNVLHN